MKRSPITRSQTVAAALQYFRSLGGDPRELLERHGLPEVFDAQLPITLATMHALIDALADACGDPFFGLHLAEDMTTRDYNFYPLLEYLGRSAPTIRSYLDAVIRYGALGNEVMVLRLSEHGDEASYESLVAGDPLCLGRHINECLHLVMVRNVARYLAAPFPLRRVWFAHDAPDVAEEVRRIIAAPHLEFGRGTNGFSFDRALLDRSMAAADPRLFGLLCAHGDQLLSLRKAKTRFLAQVRQTISDQFEERLPTIESTALIMRISARSLQRRLADEQTTFVSLLDSVREELARTRLQDPREQVSAVADALHYSDTSAFVRAFRRWTGTTPGTFRRAQ